MDKRIRVDFLKANGESTSVRIIPNDDMMGLKWYLSLEAHLKNKIPILETDRIYNLNDAWNRDRICQELIENVRIINDYREFIDFDLNPAMDQESLNRLHVYFETLMGEDRKGFSDFYRNSPKSIQTALREFNSLIHRMEDLNLSRRIVVTFDSRNQYTLGDEEYELFNFLYTPGDVVINYCHVGKPIYDFFLDDDEHVSPKNILPQYRWSADFAIHFDYGPANFHNFQKKIDGYWIKHKKFLNDLGFYQDDPKNAMGVIRVGRVEGHPRLMEDQLYGVVKVTGYAVE